MLKFDFSLYFLEDKNIVYPGAGWGHALSSTIPVELEAGMYSQANSKPAGEAIFLLQIHLYEKHDQITTERSLQHKEWSKKYKTEPNKIPF